MVKLSTIFRVRNKVYDFSTAFYTSNNRFRFLRWRNNCPNTSPRVFGPSQSSPSRFAFSSKHIKHARPITFTRWKTSDVFASLPKDLHLIIVFRSELRLDRIRDKTQGKLALRNFVVVEDFKGSAFSGRFFRVDGRPIRRCINWSVIMELSANSSRSPWWIDGRIAAATN